MKRRGTKNTLSKLSIFLAATGLAIFAYAVAWGADWKLLGISDTGKCFYDAEDVTHPSRNIVRVQRKIIYNGKGITEYVSEFGRAYENLDYSLTTIEIDCGNKTNRFLSLTFYSQDGKVIDSSNSPSKEWDVIVPETSTESLYKKVCK
jgi:hypothetical protein